MSRGSISRATLAAYALPALPLAILTLPFYVLVPAFYARDLGLPIAAVGQALLAVRVVDALSDPLIGVFADRWRPAFGRRRLWFALACAPTAISAFMVFTPPESADVAYLTFWGMALSVAWTAALAPYAAWGAELSADYAGRARVASWRETFALAGTLLALVAQALAPLAGLEGDRGALFVLGLFVLFALPLASLVAVIRTPEPADHSHKRLALRESLAHMRRNGPFLRLTLAFFLNGCANGLPATLFLFYVGERLQREEAAGPLLVLYFLCGVAGVPAWLRFSRRVSKHRAWCAAMLLACVCFVPALFLGPGDVAAFAAVCIGTGLALGADLMLPPSIQADVVDVDTAQSGEQRTGLYFAAWGLATKLALALAVAFPLLSFAGFDPGADPSVKGGLAMLSFLYAGLPVALKLAAVAVMWRFPLDEGTQTRLRTQIEAR